MSPSDAPVSQNWRSAVEQVQAFAIVSLDADGFVRLWNSGAASLFGYDACDVAGLHAGNLFSPAEKQLGEPEASLKKAQELDTVPVALTVRRKDGADVAVEGGISPIRTEAGVLAGYTVLLRTATDGTKLQRTVARLTAELHQFAFTVSHDMKAPLRSVKSFSELLERRYKNRLDGDAMEYISFIVDGAKQMEQLINDVLAFSQAGREDKTRLQKVEAAGVLQWALMNVDGMTKQTGAVVTWDQLPAVCADQGQLAQVFQHLLVNAMKFHGEEPPAIHVTSQSAPGNMVEVAVSDNGMGIDSAYFDKVFGMFKRLHGKSVPGTGVGLAICRKIVEAHGGRMWLESERDRGSTFRFTLRAA